MTTQPGCILSVLRMGRPHFLLGGLLLYWLGVTMALSRGVPLNVWALLWGQAAVTAIQLMTHYNNDYFDFAADLANASPTHWSGGSRVLPKGLLEPGVALWIAIALAASALGIALVLALMVRPGVLTFLLIAVALLLAWSYSAPPLRLHSRGVGELSTALVVTGMTPLVGFYLQTGQLGLALLGVVPLCCMQFAMLLIIEFPDAVGDAAVGKRTLVVRLGGASAARLHALALLAAYATLPLLVSIGLPLLVAASVGLGAPVAVWQGWRVLRGAWADRTSWNSLGFWAVGLLMGTTTAELLAFLRLVNWS
ncbi:MAG TPA: prenyltransferase [Roseiflexaceae bacterium]|nr:prenyltransferase [Roseiflexaceae bacterium]